jgi:hypothetical protein
MLAILFVSFMTTACDDMNSIIQDDLDKGEAIYPGGIMYMYANPGINKAMVVMYISSDSRVVKTIVTYTGAENGTVEQTAGVTTEGSDYRYEVINIPDLDAGVYTFSAYTVDKDGHKSAVASSIPVTVLTDAIGSTLPSRNIAEMELLAGGVVRLKWGEVLNSDESSTPQMLYTVVVYTDYRNNPAGTAVTDTVANGTASTDLAGLRLDEFTVKSVYQVGVDIASTALSSYNPPVARLEKILDANGLTELTAEIAAGITELRYPLMFDNGNHLRDLCYFPNLRTLDLTPGTETLPELTYTGNGVNSTVGGGPWLHFASGYMSDEDRSTIRTMLASGQLTKIKYTPFSYPRLDNDLLAYADKVEWTTNPDDIPREIMIPDNLLVDYKVQDNTKGATVEYAGDGSNVPAEIAAKELIVGNDTLPLGSLQNVYKVTVSAKNSTISFALPENVQFGFVPYGDMKMEVYVDTPDSDFSWMTQGIPQTNNYRYVCADRMTRLENEVFADHTPYAYWHSGFARWAHNDADLGKYWRSYTWALVTVPHEHDRVITIQLGNDDVMWPLPTGKYVTYYIANLRFAYVRLT